MGFIEKYFNAMEPATMEYSHNNRYLKYIFPSGERNLTMQNELNLLVESEMKMIKDKTVMIPNMPNMFNERGFSDYNVEVKSTILLCTRIMTIAKALRILGLYAVGSTAAIGEEYTDRNTATVNEENVDDTVLNADTSISIASMTEKLKYVMNVLQEEYKDICGEYFCAGLDDEINVLPNSYNGNEDTARNSFAEMKAVYTERSIQLDFACFFRMGEILNNRLLYNRIKKKLYQYMSVLYIKLELEMISADVYSYLKEQKDVLDFVSYHILSESVHKDIKKLYDDFNEYAKSLDVKDIMKYVKQCKIFVMDGGGKSDDDTQ